MATDLLGKTLKFVIFMQLNYTLEEYNVMFAGFFYLFYLFIGHTPIFSYLKNEELVGRLSDVQKVL